RTDRRSARGPARGRGDRRRLRPRGGMARDGREVRADASRPRRPVTEPSEAGMLDHVSIQGADLERSKAFYDAVLATIGGSRVLDLGEVIGYGTEFPDFWIGPQQTGEGFRESHIAFRAPSRDAVDAFQQAAVNFGTEVLHEARTWPEYHPGYYGAFVRD